MTRMHIANYFDADRFTCRAGEDMDPGDIIRIEDDGAGGRRAMKVTQQSDLVAGNWGVVMKVSADPLQVVASTVNTDSRADLGDRIITISSGDDVVQVNNGIIEMPAEEVDASLDPARSGTLPSVGDALAVVSAKWCDAGAGGAITTPVVGRVYRVFGTKILIKQVL